MVKGLYLLLLVFILQIILWNLSSKMPKLPGDISIDRPGIRVYIPFVSTFIISALILIYFNFLV